MKKTNKLSLSLIVILVLVLILSVSVPFHAYLSAKRYLDQKKPENDYRYEQLLLMPQNASYCFIFRSQSNVDDYQQVVTSIWGKVQENSYIAGNEKYNLERRLLREYDNLFYQEIIRPVLNNSPESYWSEFKPFYYEQENHTVLQPGNKYDVGEMGFLCGFVSLIVYQDSCTPEKVLDIMRTLRDKAEETGIGFREINIYGYLLSESEVRTGDQADKHFKAVYEEINDEDMLEKLKAQYEEDLFTWEPYFPLPEVDQIKEEQFERICNASGMKKVEDFTVENTEYSLQYGNDPDEWICLIRFRSQEDVQLYYRGLLERYPDVFDGAVIRRNKEGFEHAQEDRFYFISKGKCVLAARQNSAVQAYKQIIQSLNSASIGTGNQ